jgi:hypothetical protein
MFIKQEIDFQLKSQILKKTLFNRCSDPEKLFKLILPDGEERIKFKK